MRTDHHLQFTRRKGGWLTSVLRVTASAVLMLLFASKKIMLSGSFRSSLYFTRSSMWLRSTSSYLSLAGCSMGSIRQRISLSRSSTESHEIKCVRRRKILTAEVAVAALTESAAEKEMHSLAEEIEMHDHLYYEDNAPVISDAQYDKLLRRLEDIAGRFPHLVTAQVERKLQTVGRQLSRTSKFEAFVHTAPMLSLNNAFTTAELLKFTERVRSEVQSMMDAAANSSESDVHFVVEPKIDGLSLALRYSCMKYSNQECSESTFVLTGAGSRGDGNIGEDLLENVRSFVNRDDIPSELVIDGNLLQRMQSKGFASDQDIFALKSFLTSLTKQITEGDERYNQRGDVGAKTAVIEVRGELYISKENFTITNEKRAHLGLRQFVTARNAASGSIRRQVDTCSEDKTHDKDRRLQFFAYSVLFLDGHHWRSLDQQLTLQLLHGLNFRVATPWAICKTDAELVTHCNRLSFERKDWEFDADGAVIKVNDILAQHHLGETARAPRWSIAYKFSSLCSEKTRVREIKIQVGRTGVLTPVAILTPVRMPDGVVVERATLHNEQEVNRLGARPGTAVVIERAGDVIPKIVHTIVDGNMTDSGMPAKFRLPELCPVCGSATVREYGIQQHGPRRQKKSVGYRTNEEQSKDGTADLSDAVKVVVRCSGGPAICASQAVELIRHYCSRGAVNIEGLGPARIEELYQSGLLRSIADIYSLRKFDLQSTGDGSAVETAPTKSLRQRKGWGNRSVNRLLAAIDNARVIPAHRFLYGLGIRHIGLATATNIMHRFESFNELWSLLQAPEGDRTAVTERLISVPGIGPKAVQSLIIYATNKFSVEMVERLLREIQITNLTSEGIPRSNQDALIGDITWDEELSPLAGKTVAFTGKLRCKLSRAEATRDTERCGAKVAKTVTKNVEILIVGGAASRNISRKIQAAQDNGIQIWTEEQWLETCGILQER